MEQFAICIETQFDADHYLYSYKGKPEHGHSHTWKVQARFETTELDREGMALDFVGVLNALKNLSQRFDHQNINDIPPFNEISPTAEHMAKWFYSELDQPEIRQKTRLAEVTVWEGPNCKVSYKK